MIINFFVDIVSVNRRRTNMTISIQQKIDEYIVSKQRKGEGSGKYSPSLLGCCYRRQFLKRKGTTPTNLPDKRTLRVFEAGHLFHDLAQRFFDDASKEVMVENEDFLGYADIVIEDEVIDIKSQHSRAFWYMEKSNYDVYAEKLPNWLQVSFYAKMLGKEKVRLVFISKDDLCVVEIGSYLSKFEAQLEAEISLLKSVWESQVMPAAQPRAYGGKECKYCAYKDHCFNIEEKAGRPKPKEGDDE